MNAARLSVAGIVAVTALVAGASAAGTTFVLNLKDGAGSSEFVACGIRHHYTFFHITRPQHMDGAVQPVPRGTWRVKVKVKKCIRGHFRRVWAGHTKGKSDGTFKISYTPRHAGAFFARAYYYGVRPPVRSDKHYFRVH